MAVNKNFVVKNGLEVDTNTLFVDSANNRVAIGTTVPTTTLDVRGKILSDSQVESWVGKFVGIVTAGAVGVTTMTATDAVVTGFSTLGLANATSLKVTTGFSTVQSLTATDITVSIGATVTKDLNVGGATTITGAAILSSDINVSGASTVGGALTVTGQSKFAEFVRFEKDIAVGSALTVTGISTFTGATKFAESSRSEQNINVGGAATVGGALTVTGNAYFNGNVDIGGDITFDEVNARNLNISGIATLGFATAANAYVAGVTTSSLLHVGMGATMMKVIGVPATRVGINSVGPAFTLDVDGDSNVTGTVRQNGSSVVTLASGDATALAIALG